MQATTPTPISREDSCEEAEILQVRRVKLGAATVRIIPTAKVAQTSTNAEVSGPETQDSGKGRPGILTCG